MSRKILFSVVKLGGSEAGQYSRVASLSMTGALRIILTAALDVLLDLPTMST